MKQIDRAMAEAVLRANPARGWTYTEETSALASRIIDNDITDEELETFWLSVWETQNEFIPKEEVEDEHEEA